MTSRQELVWSPRIPKAKICQLYRSDSRELAWRQEMRSTYWSDLVGMETGKVDESY